MTHDTTMRTVRFVILGLAGFALAGALLMSCWNVLGHDLFGGPEAQFRHGVAAAVLIAIAAATVRVKGRHKVFTFSSGEQNR
jgi:hypothetical protein